MPASPRTRSVGNDDEGRVLPDRVLYPNDEAKPPADMQSDIDAIAAELAAHPEWDHVVVEGHASDTGDRSYNMRLSEQRAEHVRRALIRRGIDANRLRIEAYGHTRPEVRGRDEAAYTRNRRVIIRIESP